MLPGMKSCKTEHGIALITVLVTLVVMTLIVVSVTSTANFGFRIAASAQYRQEAQAAAQRVIDMRIADRSYFSTTASSTESIDIDGDGDTDYSVAVSAPRCLAMGTDPSYGINATNPPDIGLWEIVATASSAASGATATVTQGVKMLVPAGMTCSNS